MKKEKLVLSLVLALILSAVAVYGALIIIDESSPGGTGIVLSMVNQDPDPVGPNKYFDLRIKVENIGIKDVTNLVVEPVEKFPFSFDTKQNKTISTVMGIQNRKQGYILKYKIRVSKNAVQGENKIKFRYKADQFNWLFKEFNITIQTVDALVGITKVKVTPEKIAPGEIADVAITLRNMADSVMKDISVKLDLTLSSLVDLYPASTTASITSLNYLEALPFAPVDSATEKKIEKLNTGEEHTFVYKIRGYPDAESKVYKVPIQIKYRDELETNYTKNDVIGLIVGTEPELSVILDSSEITKAGTKGTVSIKMVNKGVMDLKFLNVKLKENSNYDIISSNEVYVGNVDSDDYENAEFDIYVKSNTKSSVVLPITIEFRDANNYKYEEEHNIKLKLHNSEEAKNFGLSKGNSFIGIVIVIVVVVVGLLGFRWYRKRKRAKK